MKILIPVDGSSFTKRMLAFLVAHDEWFGGSHQYTVLHVASPVPPRAAAMLDKATLQAHYDEESQKVFKPIRSFFAKQKVSADFVARVGVPADVISDTAARQRFDLVMLGSHGHGALANLVLGSVTSKVLARCDRPVLVVR